MNGNTIPPAAYAIVGEVVENIPTEDDPTDVKIEGWRTPSGLVTVDVIYEGGDDLVDTVDASTGRPPGDPWDGSHDSIRAADLRYQIGTGMATEAEIELTLRVDP